MPSCCAGRRRQRPRRHDHPASHDPRSRPPRDHRACCSSSSPTARRCSSSVAARTAPVRPRRRSCRRLPARGGPSGRLRPTTSAPRSSARCARRCRRSSTTPARARACATAIAPACDRDAWSCRPGTAPFAPYHWLLFGESLYFDITKAATELGWEPTHSNASMLIESYEWFLADRDGLARRRAGRTTSRPVRPGLLRVLEDVAVIGGDPEPLRRPAASPGHARILSALVVVLSIPLVIALIRAAPAALVPAARLGPDRDPGARRPAACTRR